MICFSLDQQREVFRDENFRIEPFQRVVDVMANVEFSTVDYRVVSRPQGHRGDRLRIRNGVETTTLRLVLDLLRT